MLWQNTNGLPVTANRERQTSCEATSINSCQIPDFKFSPWLKIWSGSIFGVLFVRLFVRHHPSVGRSVGGGDLRIEGWGILGDLEGMVDLHDTMVDLSDTLVDLPATTHPCPQGWLRVKKTRPQNVFLETLSVSKISILRKFQLFWLGAFLSMDPCYHYTHPISNLI